MLRQMPLLWALARLGFRQQFAYVSAALSGMLTNLFFAVLRISVLLALFGTQSKVGGYSVSDTLTYVALTQTFISAFLMFGWSDLMRAIHQGEIVTDLLRPLNLLAFWAAQDAGRAAGQLLMRGLPMLLLMSLVWSAQAPANALHASLSIVLAWATGFLFRFLVNCAAFWSPDATGIGRFAWALQGLGCGFLMPLAFFPDWLQKVLYFTPFPSMLNSLVEIWLGRNGASGGAGALLATQLFWVLLLILLCQWTLKRGLRRLEVAGG